MTKNLEYFEAAYLILWVMLFAYLFYLHRKLARLEKQNPDAKK